jgi:general secretion pathway protein J
MRFGRCPGFSLLEMLLAITVFALVAAAAYGILNSMTAAAAAQETAAARLREVQLTVARLEREIHQALSAGMLSDGTARPGLQGGTELMELDYLSPAPGGPAIRRMQYRYEDGVLYRVPLRNGATLRSATRAPALLQGVSRLAFSYRGPAGDWRPEWNAASPGELPAALRLEMEIDRFGHLERLFELPGDRP